MSADHRSRRRGPTAAIAAAATAGLLLTALAPLPAAAAGTIAPLFDYEDGSSPHIQWGAAGAGVEPVDPAGAGTWGEPNQNVLSYGFDLTADPFYGGMGYEFGGVAAQDWTAYDGIRFWLHSDGSDASIQVEILDATSATSTVHDRWDTVVPVGEAGWHLVSLPFDTFAYATDYQDAGAPADGTLDLSHVRGVLFPGNFGSAVVKLDEIALYADDEVAVTVGAATAAVEVTEGDAATIPVRLSAPAATEVTVDYATADGTALAGEDYTATSGTLTFAAGERDAEITVPTADDGAADGDRAFTVTLADPAGAALAAATVTVTIRDDAQAPSLGGPVIVIEDFEAAPVLADPAAVPPLGWFTAQGAGNVPDFARVVDGSRPDSGADNDVLEIGFDTSSWAVVLDTFTDDGTTWEPQDWSASAGLGFWMLGTDSGAPLFVDVLDNRNPDSTVDDAERFSVRFVDDWSGWRFVEFPFADFTRKNIGNGAPDDGFTLTEIHGFAIGVEQSAPTVTPRLRFDDVSLVGEPDGDRPTVINFARSIFTVTEGEEAAVVLRLNRPAPEDVTVAYRTERADDRTSTEDLPATPDRDFVSASGVVTIPAGEREATNPVPTVSDGKAEVDETFLVRLSDPVGAELNPLAVGRVSIVDTQAPDPWLIDDFENEARGLQPLDGAGLGTTEIAAADADAYPGQDAYDHVLDVTDAGGFARSFAQPQDWSEAEGLGFWFEGEGTGAEIAVDLRGGRTADVPAEDWVLRWSDEFDGAAGTPADPRYWTYETGGWGWGNEELQYYTDSTDNAAHDGEGNMVITTREVADPEAAGLECWYGPCTHTSARLITEEKAEFLHGRIEARAQLPAGEPGIWPAIWSLGTDFRDVGWPRTGEIDVMEYVGKLPEEIFGTIHGPGYSGGNAWHATHEFGEDIGGSWMTFSVEWEPGEIRWYVTPEGGEEIAFHSAVPADVAPSEWVFEHPFFLIMNMAVGGNFGGALGADLTFPQELKVDYIRVFQAPDDADTFRTTFTDDVAGWRFVELPFAEFEGAAGTVPEAVLRTVDGYAITRVAAPAAAGVRAAAAAAADGAGFRVDTVRLLAEITAVPEEEPEPGDGGDPVGEPGDGGGSEEPSDVDGSTVDGSDDGGSAGGTDTPDAAGLASTGSTVPYGALTLAVLLLLAGLVVRARARAARG